MILIDGKAISNEICKELELEIKHLAGESIVPTLVIIQVGHNPASDVYVRNKLRLSQKLNVNTSIQKYPETITNEELLASITKLNKDPKINGILVQMPLPKHIDERQVIATIDPNKDVDCFHLINIGRL
jgi:methylenetetrahydrofolate dehydrogenase (NADP+)/methenyltetrahydrofolate cyclohydrolase